MPRSSDQSYQDFVQIAFDYFKELKNPRKPNIGDAATILYRRYYKYHPDPLVAAKVPLAGDALYTALDELIKNVGNRIIRVQSDDWGIMNNNAVATARPFEPVIRNTTRCKSTVFKKCRRVLVK